MRELVLHKIEGLEHQHKGIGGRRRCADLMSGLQDNRINFSSAKTDGFLDGDGILHGGVGDAIVSGIPTGQIALTWENLSGFTAPEGESQVLVRDGTVTVLVYAGFYS